MIKQMKTRRENIKNTKFSRSAIFIVLCTVLILLLLTSFLANQKTSAGIDTASAWVAPGDSHDFIHRNGGNQGINDSPMTSQGVGNFPEIPTGVITNVGVYNLYDTSLTQVENGVPSVFRLKAEDLDSHWDPDGKAWNTESAWRAHSSKAWVCNFGSGAATKNGAGLSGQYMHNGNTQRSMFFTTIRLSDEIIEGLKAGRIEITFSTYADNFGATGQTTGAFIALGQYGIPANSADIQSINGYTYSSTDWRDLHNFQTIYGNTSGDAEYKIYSLNADGTPNFSSQRTNGVSGLGNRFKVPDGTPSPGGNIPAGRSYIMFQNLVMLIRKAKGSLILLSHHIAKIQARVHYLG